uniref:Cytochrome c oxidase subunit n=1 Tax=Odontella aurita TaxID=265563 RepID=A0A7S4JKT8_9STRA|mmetsp:Transcript_48175/g.145545  ORF Transcript_48175/g.145545 Transcript_48175/m.145545 type:complete len:106 (+) Transcript_48175:155-472(+)|eukprot:CAMPEP_0113550258 /NCGR_PEP_ID=MMETSP0015_2-20120614/13886_1 /TAXON_ID=2838 /ORGANISM="Odontella" /LENGTH=105 /DNA_ID=CAMNT_0000451053 /DNA_START=84 /DNA_END=401 /DNA_ORIENTATION=- /assembly_acc=CAM_ASM_000160
MGGAEPKINKLLSAPAPELSSEEAAALDVVKSVRTTPRDARFPSQNQSNHCWNRYNEWLLCLKSTGGDEAGCKHMRQMAVSICPSIWSEKWDEEREENTYPGIKA